MNDREPDGLVERVVRAFALGDILDTQLLGGTATKKWSVRTPLGRFVVRMRPQRVADVLAAAFDHAVLRRLADQGLPVPLPWRQVDGTSVFLDDDTSVEVLSWIDGETRVQPDSVSAGAVGKVLRLFHNAMDGVTVPGRKESRREDYPDGLAPTVAALRTLANSQSRAGLDRVEKEIEAVKIQLDSGLYATLPRAIVHGDFHPGNVRFRGSEVAAIYDFDYMSSQARVRDLADAIAFFCSRRNAEFLPDNILSLTQPFVPDFDLCAVMLSGYGGEPLLLEEWRALPLLLRSRWAQIRLRGSRKVPEQDRVAFVLDRFEEVSDWLAKGSPLFFSRLKQAISS